MFIISTAAQTTGNSHINHLQLLHGNVRLCRQEPQAAQRDGDRPLARAETRNGFQIGKAHGVADGVDGPASGDRVGAFVHPVGVEAKEKGECALDGYGHQQPEIRQDGMGMGEGEEEAAVQSALANTQLLPKKDAKDAFFSKGTLPRQAQSVFPPNRLSRRRLYNHKVPGHGPAGGQCRRRS